MKAPETKKPDVPFDPGSLGPSEDPVAVQKARDELAAAEAEAKRAAEASRLFDPKSVEQQIDVIREHLRKLWAQVGPVPVALAANHDMSWEAREDARLKKAADDAQAKADAIAARDKPAKAKG